MSKRDFFRILYFLGYVGLIGVCVYVVSSIFLYLNSGADRASILNTSIENSSNYLPEVEWIDNGNFGREIPPQTIEEIKSDYATSWYENALANATNLPEGLANHFTESAKKPIIDVLKFNQEQNLSIKQTTLTHNLDPELFSEDGQLVVFKDVNSLHYKRVLKQEEPLHNVYETADFKIIMLLEDGYWKIRHCIKENATFTNFNQRKLEFSIQEMKGINYYPKNYAWQMFDYDIDAQIFKNDFKIIKQAKLNTIRIFIPYASFGEATVDEQKLARVDQFLAIATQEQIHVIVTLFDFYGDYEVLDWTKTNKHLKSVVNHLKKHESIVAWDVKNEPDLDFESRGKTNVIEWLKFTVNALKIIDDKPITIGWSSIDAAQNLANEVDFVSFHFYENIDLLETKLQTLKKQITNKPILLQEFGTSSYKGIWNLFLGSKNKQAVYHKKIQEIIGKNKLPFISWTLYDFDSIPADKFSKKPWVVNKQKNFGFIDVNGKKKPSFTYISN